MQARVVYSPKRKAAAAAAERHYARLAPVTAECGAVVAAAWLQTGPALNQRVRPRRVALIGPEARE